MVVLALAAVGAGCMGTTHTSRASAPSRAAAEPQGGMAPSRPGGMGMMEGPCPMAVPGAQVVASDTPAGEAITFTTTSPDAVPELRSRVVAMADMYNRHHASGQAESSPGGMDAGQGGTDAGQGGMDAGQGGMQTGEGSAGSGDGSETPQTGAGMGEMHGMMAPPSHAVVVDVDGGSRMVFAPDDPNDLDQLRTAIRDHADRRSRPGACGAEQGAAPQQ